MKFKFKPEEFLTLMMTADTNFKKLGKVAGVASVTVASAAKGNPVQFQTYIKLCRALNLTPIFSKEMF